MELIIESSDLERYLESSEVVDIDDGSVRRLADGLATHTGTEVDKVRSVFEYMQANIPHTFDTDRKEVACKASDVIRLGHGICYAKANLGAALLRYMGIPAGFCYQKFRMEGTMDSKFVLHCFNAVFFRDMGIWARMDVRTAGEGFDPTFKPFMDSGIFPADAALGEMEYPGVYVNPIPSTIAALKNSRDAIELHDKLPEGL